MVILLSAKTLLLGQTTPAVRPIFRSENLLSTAASSKIAIIRAQPETFTALSVSVNFQNFVSGTGQIRFQPLGQNATWVFRIQSAFHQDDNNYSVFGELEDIENDPSFEWDCEWGKFGLTKIEGRYIATFTKELETYQIRELASGEYVQREIKPSPKPVCNIGNSGGEDNGRSLKSKLVEAADRNNECPVNLLICYTQAAKDANPFIVDDIYAEFYHLQHILLASTISTSDLSVHLSSIELILPSQWKEIPDDAQPLSIPSAPIFNSLRNQHSADVVIIVTDNVYPSFKGAIAANNPQAINSTNAFAIVEVGEINTSTSETFAHEFAHLFDCHHHRSENCETNDDDSGPLQGHGYLITKGFHCGEPNAKFRYLSVVAPCYIGDVVTIDRYSTPNIRIRHKTFGRENRNDNASQLRDQACVVANFNPNNQPTLRIIPDKDIACMNELVYFRAYLDNTPTPYEYNWSFSYDGINFTPAVSGTSWNKANAPATPFSRVYAKVCAGTVGSPLICATTSVQAAYGNQYCERSIDVMVSNSMISPNPSSGKFRLRTEIFSDNFASRNIEVFDLYGKLVLKDKIVNQVQDFDLSNHLSSGFYIVKLLDQFNKLLMTEKLILKN
jgi:Secretion system C-terminal sorting domain